MKYSAIAILHTFSSPIAHALGFSAFTNRILATESHCNFNSHMKSSWHSLIPFLPLFCSCQFRRLDSTTLDYCSILPDTLLLLLLSCQTLLITTLHGPHGKHRLLLSKMHVYCSVTYQWTSYSARLLLRECVHRPVVQQWVYTSQYNRLKMLHQLHRLYLFKRSLQNWKRWISRYRSEFLRYLCIFWDRLR
jgi:hypothetical protein